MTLQIASAKTVCSANPEKAFGFRDNGRIANELKSDSTLALFEHNSKPAKLMPFEAAAHILLGLA